MINVKTTILNNIPPQLKPIIKRCIAIIKRPLAIVRRTIARGLVLTLKRKSISKYKDINKQTILIWAFGGMTPLYNIEISMALALMKRGHKVIFLICGGHQSACIKREVGYSSGNIQKWSATCISCARESGEYLDKFGIDYISSNSVIKSSDVSATEMEIADSSAFHQDGIINKQYAYEGVTIGANVYSSVVRYYQGSDGPYDSSVLNAFFKMALANTLIAKTLVQELNPDKVVMSHGIYVDYGPAAKIFKKFDIPVFNWTSGYKTNHMYINEILCVDKISTGCISKERWESLKKESTSFDSVSFVSKFFTEKYGLTWPLAAQEARQRRKWVIFAHVLYDGVADYLPMLYDSFKDWLADTINCAIKNDNVDWIIKFHPGESALDERYRARYLLNQRGVINNLPPHVTIVEHDSIINPAELILDCDGVVTVYGTSGIEAVMLGKSCILGGDAHYGGLGFTYDASSIAEYRELLYQVHKLKPPSQDKITDSVLFSHWFFNLKQIPFDFIKSESMHGQMSFLAMFKLIYGCEKFVRTINNGVIHCEGFEVDVD